MNAAAIINLIVALISSLGPVVQRLVAGSTTPEEARTAAYAAVDAFLSDLAGLHARITADDAAAVGEVVGRVPGHEKGAVEVRMLPIDASEK